MAKILASQKSGSVGTSTFVQTAHGLVERQRVIPLDPKTPRQLHQRHLLASVAHAWRGLTDVQRAGWRALASQRPGPPSGYHTYQGVNATRLACGLPALEAAPPPPRFGLLVCSGLVADDTPSLKLLQVSATVAPDAFLVAATPALSAGIGWVEKRFVRVAVVPGHAGPPADLDVTAAYLACFPAPRAGKRIFVRLCALKDGFKSAPVQLEALVAQREVLLQQTT